MSVSFLTDKHFALSPNGKTQLMMLKVPGLALVYFKMIPRNSEGKLLAPDKNCEVFDPIYNAYANKESRVKCLCVDVYQFRHIVNMSKTSNTPITSVPSLVLYLDGYPKAKIKPQTSPGALMHHVTEVMNRLQESQYASSSSSSSYNTEPVFEPPRGGHPPTKHMKTKTYAPEGGRAAVPTGYVDDDDEHLLMPTDIIPYNTPWESEIRNL